MGNIFGEILDAIGGKGGDRVQAPNIPLPVLKQLHPELYKQIVMQNPELETAQNLGPSAMEGISLDPRLRQAQMNALSKLQDISNSDGKDAQFLADNARLTNDVNSQLKGNSDAITQNLATRGMSGGMTEMVQKQLAAQQGANRAAQQGLDLNAQAQQRALSALMNGANLGGQMSAQDFSQQSQIAQAKDAINKFNTQNMQQVQNNNVGIRNNAQIANANNAQNIANQNTQTLNDTQKYNTNGLAQQNYDNATGAAKTQAQLDLEEQKRQDARRQGNLGFAGGLISSGATAYGNKKTQG